MRNVSINTNLCFSKRLLLWNIWKLMELKCSCCHLFSSVTRPKSDFISYLDVKLQKKKQLRWRFVWEMEIGCVTVVLMGCGAATLSSWAPIMFHSGAAESQQHPVLKVSKPLGSMAQYQSAWTVLTAAGASRSLKWNIPPTVTWSEQKLMQCCVDSLSLWGTSSLSWRWLHGIVSPDFVWAQIWPAQKKNIMIWIYSCKYVTLMCCSVCSHDEATPPPPPQAQYI